MKYVVSSWIGVTGGGGCVLMLHVVQLLQNNGPPAVAEIPVLVPTDHLLCVPGQRSHYQPVAALYFTSVAGQ